jgi:hypothetical protein
MQTSVLSERMKKDSNQSVETAYLRSGFNRVLSCCVARRTIMVQVLCYKPEGRGFETVDVNELFQFT